MLAYQEKLQQALSLLQSGKVQEAFRAFRPILHYPGLVKQANELAEVLGVFADIGGRIAGQPFAAVVRDAAEHPKQEQALYRLGYELIEQGLADMAATVLAHAHRLYPDSAALLHELSAALEQEGLYAQARTFLQAAPHVTRQHFLGCYLLAFNALMSGDLATPRRLLPDLHHLQEQDARFESMTRRIVSMLRRADAVTGSTPLDQHDLRGWHLVITAGLLLHLSPHGFDAGMNGRYAFVQDTKEQCLEGIRRVGMLLEALQISVPRVFALPDRDSLILAHACAHVLNCPLDLWPAGGSEAPGLVVAYDLGQCDGEVLSSLLQHRPGQILWSHAACWTSEQPIAADLCTFLYQVNIAPWGEQMTVDSQTHTMKRDAPDERDPAVIGAEIAATTLEPGSMDDVHTLLTLARAAAVITGEDAPGMICPQGNRGKQWVGSPVSSSRFA